MNMKYLAGLPLLFCAGAVHAQYLGPISAPCVVQPNLSCVPVTAATPLPVSGGSSGGPATIADGADVSEGATTAPAYTDTTGAAAGTVNGLNKGQFVQLYGIRTALVGVATAANQTATGAAAQTIQGNAAAATTDAGNPIEIGGYVSTSTASQATTGQRVKARFGPDGALAVSPDMTQITTSYTTGAIGLPVSNGAGGVPIATGLLEPNIDNPGFFAMPTMSNNGANVVSRGGAGLVTGQVSVGTTATLIAAGRAGRQRLVITQSAAGPCYYGPTNTVSATTGARIIAAGGTKPYLTASALYGICPGGAVTVDVDEEY